MKPSIRTVDLEELRERLREAEETLAAIRTGEVDSLIVCGPAGDQVFSLKGAEQPYRVFVEQMQEGAVTATPEGMILYANRRFAEMVKAPLEKVIGASIWDYLEDESLRAVFVQRATGKSRVHVRAGDGSRIAAQVGFSPLPHDDLEALCIVVTDLTEQEHMRELSDALARLHVVQDELREQNNALDKARAEADAANDAKDHFLAALSHELRTPLTPVLLTAASLSANAELPQEVRDALQIVRKNVELEARLIDDLLDLTRITRGKVDLKLEPVDLHATIKSVVEMCKSDINSKRLQLKVERDCPAAVTRGDSVRLHQILWNLLRNAVKFTPDGGEICITCDVIGDQLEVSIRDSGIGIATEALPRIFKPFEQADRMVTQHFGGLGLGLAISRQLAEILGGTLTAQSDGRNKGATFTLSLPRHDGPMPAQVDETHRADGQAKALSILLVEDHEDTRRSMALLLGRKHRVYDVSDIATATRVAQITRFDLVISDIGLPDGSGLDLMRLLNERYGLKGICLSGYGMENDVNNSAKAGFFRHLTKPIEMSKLEAAIRAAIE